MLLLQSEKLFQHERLETQESGQGSVAAKNIVMDMVAGERDDIEEIKLEEAQIKLPEIVKIQYKQM